MSGKMSQLSFNKQKLQYGFWKSTRFFIFFSHHLLLTPFWVNIFYLVVLSLLGFGILTCMDPRTAIKPRNIDLFFTSVSATTGSSMSTVEMEVFSNGQLIVMTVLIFTGSKVFISIVGLLLGCWCSKVLRVDGVEPVQHNPISTTTPSINHIELSNVMITESRSSLFESKLDLLPTTRRFTDYSCIYFLGLVILCYVLVIQLLGISSVLMYLSCVESAADVLRNKGLNTITFAIFTAVSTFTNCGFIATNENMVAFSKNSGFLWILIPQILLGNTLFPPALRILLWFLGNKLKQTKARFLLQNSREVGYYHLLPALHSISLAATVFGFIFIGFTLFCFLEWNSELLTGLTSYQKAVAIVFHCINARHAGENIVDLSTIAPPMLVFFIFMMYLPPYTLFLPITGDEQSSVLESKETKNMRKSVAENLIFSPLTYIVIFIILICITERKSLKEDPINFSVLNIAFEVISAFGNVGFTTGYSCERRLSSDQQCVNKLYGFSGKWTDKGKGILIIAMFLGRLKKFNWHGGQAWKLK